MGVWWGAGGWRGRNRLVGLGGSVEKVKTLICICAKRFEMDNSTDGGQRDLHKLKNIK